MSKWRWSSGRKGDPHVPAKSAGGKRIRCPACGTKNLRKYGDGTIEKHKIYARDAKNRIVKEKFSYCPQTRWTN